MFEQWHITTPDSGINNAPYPKVPIPTNGLADQLGPFNFVVRDAYDGILIGDQVVLATPTYPYFPDGRQATIYALNQDGTPSPTAIKLDQAGDIQPAFYPQTFEAFIDLFGKWRQTVRPQENNTVFGFNFASLNHLAFQFPYAEFINHPVRRRLAQSVPIFHGQVLEVPRDQHDLYYDIGPNLYDREQLESLGGKLVREYQIPFSSEDEIRQRVAVFMNMWLCEQQDWSQWSLYRDAFNEAIVANPIFQRLRRSTYERLPQYYNIPPYGFEFCTEWPTFDQIIENGAVIGELLYGFEAAVASRIDIAQYNGEDRLPGYNYNCIFFFEGGLLKCVFAPHSIRTGLMESMGFIVHRPSRKNT